METAVTFLAIYGVVFTICDAKILERPRLYMMRWSFVRDLFSCYFCVGFWVSLSVFVLTKQGLHVSNIATTILLSFAGASVSYLLDLVASVLELKKQM